MYESRIFSDSKTKEVILPSSPANDQKADHSHAAAQVTAFLTAALLTNIDILEIHYLTALRPEAASAASAGIFTLPPTFSLGLCAPSASPGRVFWRGRCRAESCP